MIKADELYNINYLNKLDVTIMKEVIRGSNNAEVPYTFEKHSVTEINFIKDMLIGYGYSVDEVKLFADTKQVGVIFDIYW